MKLFKRKGRQEGFTILEVLIATTIFSFSFAIIALGFVEITKLYRQGISIRTVQQNSRFILDDIIRSSRTAATITSTGPSSLIINYPLGRANPEGGGTSQATMYCFTDEEIRKYDNPSSLDCGTIAKSSGDLLLENNVKLLNSDITPIGTRSASIRFNIGIGATDILTASGCIDGPGRQYCAVDEVRASVTARGGSDG